MSVVEQPIEQQLPAQVQRVVDTFDAIADDYDQGGVEYFGSIAQLLVDAVNPRPGERALDVGCGRGAVTTRLAGAVRPGGHVTGIDLSARMLQALGADLKAGGYGDVELHQRDASDPGLPPSSYDVVTASLVIFFLPDAGAALRAWHEVLRPGGRLGLTTFGTRDEVRNAIDRQFAPHVPPAVLDARTSGQSGPFSSAASTSALVTDAGFVDTDTREVTFPVRYASPEHWHDWSWTVGMRALWLSVPESERPAVKAAVLETLAPLRAPDGSLVIDQTVRVTTARRA